MELLLREWLSFLQRSLLILWLTILCASFSCFKRQDHRDHAAFVVKTRRDLHGLRRACALPFLHIGSSTYLQWPLRVDSASVETV
jgi:hypothetical protein